MRQTKAKPGDHVSSNKFVIAAALLLLVSLVSASHLSAQNNRDYRELAMQQQQQPLYFNFFVLPGSSDSTVTFASAFSLSYDYLPFKKHRSRSSENQFYSTAEISLEILKGDESGNSSLDNLEPVTRTFWEDSIFAETYEQTQSGNEFLEGQLAVTLKPGTYDYVVQMKRGDQAENQLSRSQQKEITLYDQMDTGSILFGEKLEEVENPSRMKLSSMGENVEYGQDFFSLAYLPDYNSGATYSLHINRLRVSNGDTSNISEVYTQQLSDDDIHTDIRPELTNTGSGNYIRLSSGQQGYTYALVKIPNRTFPNARYHIYITNEDDEIISQNYFQSTWRDIPTSLLSLDMAIDMLKFIVNEETLRNISRGSSAERREAFHEFWNQRDPTPETNYNELMAEYYRRIDYAYENFTTDNTIGYESDRGEIYINFGAPQNIERKFPTDGATVEIWEYANRRFVFRATTGFGDFKLMSN